MATFDSPLGSIKGKVGNIITYKVKTQSRIRATPLEYHDANTVEQQKSRRRLTVIVRFYSKLKDTPIIDVWRIAAIPTPTDRYSLFRKINMNVFLPTGKIGDFSKLRLAKGELPQVLNIQMEIDAEDRITLSWTNHLEHTTSRNEDPLHMIALYENRSFSPALLEGVSATRKDEKAVFHVDRKTGYPLHLYAFFGSPEKDAYSDDQYLKVTFK